MGVHNLMKSTRQLRKEQLSHDVKEFIDSTFLDVQGFSSKTTTIDEAYLARVLTKLAIGSATVWWSILEVKDFFILRRRSRQ